MAAAKRQGQHTSGLANLCARIGPSYRMASLPGNAFLEPGESRRRVDNGATAGAMGDGELGQRAGRAAVQDLGTGRGAGASRGWAEGAGHEHRSCLHIQVIGSPGRLVGVVQTPQRGRTFP